MQMTFRKVDTLVVSMPKIGEKKTAMWSFSYYRKVIPMAVKVSSKNTISKNRRWH